MRPPGSRTRRTRAGSPRVRWGAPGPRRRSWGWSQVTIRTLFYAHHLGGVLRIDDITLRRGARVLLDHASMHVHPGQKAGLVGPNGSGKSSLFALIRGELHADAGEVSMPPRWVLAHVAQETPAVERAALEFAMDGDVELREIEASIAKAESEHDTGAHLAELHARYGEIGGYQARARAQTLLAGLGFGEQAQARFVATFSGGWRMRPNLPRALMCRAHLLLL